MKMTQKAIVAMVALVLAAADSAFAVTNPSTSVIFFSRLKQKLEMPVFTG
jgi:hypothetical protein